MMLAAELPPSDLDQYLDSMPADYASVFAARDIREHARIVLARGDQPVAVEVWRRFPDGSSVIVVVADDRPGLLSFVAAALVDSDLTVQDAQAYCRQCAAGAAEAVDLFWIAPARDGRALDAEVVARIRSKLCELVTNAEMLAAADADNPFDAPTLVTSIPIHVTFDERARRRGKHVLMVETRDVMGLMLSISSTLHRLGVAIEASDIRTNGGLARDRFTLRAKSGALDESGLREIVERITATIQALHAAQRS